MTYYVDTDLIYKKHTTFLDRFALLLGITRNYKETIYEFYKRLNIFNYKWNIDKYGINKTTQGIINDISVTLEKPHFNAIEKHIYFLNYSPSMFKDSNNTLADVHIYIDTSGIYNEFLPRLKQYPILPSGWVDLGLSNSYFDSLGNKIAESGWLLWRNEDGTYTNILELINLPKNGAKIKANYWIKKDDIFYSYEDIIDPYIATEDTRLLVFNKTSGVFNIYSLSDDSFYSSLFTISGITTTMQDIIEKQHSMTSLYYKDMEWNHSMWIDEDTQIKSILFMENDL